MRHRSVLARSLILVTLAGCDAPDLFSSRSFSFCCDAENPPELTAGTTVIRFRAPRILVFSPSSAAVSVTNADESAVLIAPNRYGTRADVRAKFEFVVSECFDGSRSIVALAYEDKNRNGILEPSEEVDPIERLFTLTNTKNLPAPAPPPGPPPPDPGNEEPTGRSVALPHGASAAADMTVLVAADVVGQQIPLGLCVALDVGTFGLYAIDEDSFRQTPSLVTGLTASPHTCAIQDGVAGDGIHCGVVGVATSTAYTAQIGFGLTAGRTLAVRNARALAAGGVRLETNLGVEDTTFDETTATPGTERVFHKAAVPGGNPGELIGAHELEPDLWVVCWAATAERYLISLYDTSSPNLYTLLISNVHEGAPQRFEVRGGFGAVSLPETGEVALYDLRNRGVFRRQSVTIGHSPRDLAIAVQGSVFHTYAATEDGVYHFAVALDGATSPATRIDLPPGIRCDFVCSHQTGDGRHILSCNDLDAAFIHVLKAVDVITDAIEFTWNG